MNPKDLAEFFIDLMDVEAYVNKTERKDTSAYKMFEKYGYFKSRTSS